ncbi:hypothetical protein YC2023_016629 [Brassica napus]
MQYDERLFLPEQKGQNPPRPTPDLRVGPFRLVHKGRIPIFQDHIILLHEMRQNQSKPLLKEINEFQKSWANPKKIPIYPMPNSCQEAQARKHDMCSGYPFVTPKTRIRYSPSCNIPTAP